MRPINPANTVQVSFDINSEVLEPSERPKEPTGERLPNGRNNRGREERTALEKPSKGLGAPDSMLMDSVSKSHITALNDRVQYKPPVDVSLNLAYKSTKM